MNRAATTTSTDDHCPVCHVRTSTHTHEWRLTSRHRTSEGEVEYCVGGCGCLVVLVDGEMVKSVSPGRSQPGG